MNDDLARYWSFARQNLRLTDAEFWRLTPREFNALADRWTDDQKSQDRRAATICMVIANCNRDPKHKPQPFEVSDFMPQYGRQAPVEQSWETQKAIFAAIAASHKPTA